MPETLHTPPTGPSREAILDLLRWGPLTAQELATPLGLTLNGIRAQLAILERDHLVARTGVRHLTTPGKPPLLFGLTRTAEEALSRAYPEALRSLVEVLRDQMSEAELELALGRAGRRLGQAVRSTDAAAVLASLGAKVAVTQGADGTEQVAGGSCPLATVVRGTPVTCELVRSLLATSLGREVAMCCHHGDNPRCGFSIQPA